LNVMLPNTDQKKILWSLCSDQCDVRVPDND
jgi:hypothetical protein